MRIKRKNINSISPSAAATNTAERDRKRGRERERDCEKRLYCFFFLWCVLNCNVYIWYIHTQISVFILSIKVHIRSLCTHIRSYTSTRYSFDTRTRNDEKNKTNMTIGLFYRIGGATTTIIAVMRLPSLCQMNVWHTHTHTHTHSTPSRSECIAWKWLIS